MISNYKTSLFIHLQLSLLTTPHDQLLLTTQSTFHTMYKKKYHGQKNTVRF
jgi:hypothetical protein